MKLYSLVASIALATTSASMNTHASQSVDPVNGSLSRVSLVSSSVQVRRNMRLRKFKLGEFTAAMRQRHPSTYKNLVKLPAAKQRLVLDAFNEGTNVTQLMPLIDGLL